MCVELWKQILNHWTGWQAKILETLKKNSLLGFISFGGPPVHFQILRKKFVEEHQWLDEAMFQELFAVCQALSGPASTKMLYCINLNKNGTLLALLAFFLWSLPGAVGMYGLALGISNIGDSLPAPAYALLSGLNAATVGIIALAAVQLSQKVITDQLTRALVFFGGAAGLLYKALWYFPVLIVTASLVTVIYDFQLLQTLVSKISKTMLRRRTANESHEVEMNNVHHTMETDALEDRRNTLGIHSLPVHTDAAASSILAQGTPNDERVRVVPGSREMRVSWKSGTVLIAGFFLIFTIIMVLRGSLKDRPLLFSLFSNMYLAGTIIFGGGPVVIPLLREYIVTEGWVSSRDFLLGLAIVQSFPGPNFNFAVYLGTLTATNASLPGAVGAIIGFVGIFAPGLILVHGTMGIWQALRTYRWVKFGLRGINAVTVGFIYTAVYRLWETGYIDQYFTSGSSLGRDPWWLVITATSYVGGCWFHLPVPIAILLGGAMGLIRYGVTRG